MEPKAAFRILRPDQVNVTARELKGREYREILERVRRIILHQRTHQIADGIRGFIFHGEVGIGKTVTAKALAYEVGSTLLFIDGSDIARPLYGEAENQIANVFKVAGKGSIHTIVLIDDCESVFPSRDWMKGESWHIAQNNVFFHELDGLDTSRICVVLTTNRYDLLDRAVKDRLVPIEFPLPSEETLKEIAVFKCSKLKMDNVERVVNQIGEGKFKTIRELVGRLSAS
ncbi:MAG: AAA family ATPase [Thermoplasmata archaeon]